MASFLRSYALGVVLGVLYVVSHLVQWLTHDGSFVEFVNATAENWQSEFLQVLAFVILSRYFVFRDSPQSRDGAERLERKVDRILHFVFMDGGGHHDKNS